MHILGILAFTTTAGMLVKVIHDDFKARTGFGNRPNKATTSQDKSPEIIFEDGTVIPAGSFHDIQEGDE